MDAARHQAAGVADADELAARAEADASTAPLVFFMFCCAMVWLVVASASPTG